jgi:type IV secretion system coupling TraD/TrwB family protein
MMERKRKGCVVRTLDSGVGALILCVPVVAFGQAASPFMTGATALQTNILILRCAGSEHGGTSQFASRLIGEREVIRRQMSRGRDRESFFATRGARRSTSISEQHVTEAAVLASQIEQLPDLTGYLKTASSNDWLRVSFRAGS